MLASIKSTGISETLKELIENLEPEKNYYFN